MEKRFVFFIALAFGLLALNAALTAWKAPPPAANVAKNDKAKNADAGKPKDAAKAPDKKDQEKVPAKVDANQPAADPNQAEAKPEPPKVEPAKTVPAQWVSLGSVDPQSPYRMLVTLTNRGAAIERVELSNERYRELEDRSGYLGQLALEDSKKPSGAIVHAVGAGTPAATAGLKPDDIITAVGDTKVVYAVDLLRALEKTKPGDTVSLTALRDKDTVKLSATLGRRPLDMLRPEFHTKAVPIVKPGNHDPLSMLFTIQKLDDEQLAGEDKELKGIDLVSGNWEVSAVTADSATFTKKLADRGLQVVKRYKLAKSEQAAGLDDPSYHLMFDVEVTNIGDSSKKLAYQLDGPTGLVLEGTWYASKISRNWGGGGLRDIIVQAGLMNLEIGGVTIAKGDATHTPESSEDPLRYVAVDGQYFSAAILPQRPLTDRLWLESINPIRVGAVPEDKANLRLTNVSFRLTSVEHELAAGGQIKHSYQLFAGPKRPALLDHYGSDGITLASLVYYGMWPFSSVAALMSQVLHGFYSLVSNYGLAIIMLTVLVRGCMFPLSRKQALSAQKMQELQPEMKKIAEKFAKSPEQRAKAQQELFKKHNYNPLGGCLLMFIQLPIFIGLYRALSVDIELRGAPLISEAFAWCSNLAAPDMFYRWTWMPDFVQAGTGFLGLGPYLNLLPLVTIGLFIWQQKMFLPPPTDEQTAMQQKVMQYMMIFMGIMFFKVPSGLCIYFIASSLWGIAERKLLPKTLPPGTAVATSTAPVSDTSSNGSQTAGKKKQRGRK